MTTRHLRHDPGARTLLALALLLARGANVDATCAEGATPLSLAALNGRKGAVDLLISKGARVDVQARVEGGWTQLHDAAVGGLPDLAELLIAKGAEVDARGHDGTTPLYLAAKLDRADVAGEQGNPRVATRHGV